MPPEVIERRHFFDREIQLCDRTFFLPCHQSVSLRLIKRIVNSVLLSQSHKFSLTSTSLDGLDAVFDKFQETNLFQSPGYLHAKSENDNKSDVRLIFSADGNLIGSVGLIKKKFFGANLYHLNRSLCWLRILIARWSIDIFGVFFFSLYLKGAKVSLGEL